MRDLVSIFGQCTVSKYCNFKTVKYVLNRLEKELGHLGTTTKGRLRNVSVYTTYFRSLGILLLRAQTPLVQRATTLENHASSSPHRSLSPALDPEDTLHLSGCTDIDEASEGAVRIEFGFWATRFMELFQYCTGSRVLVYRAYQSSMGDSKLFVEDMQKRGLTVGQAKFLFDMLESVALDMDTLQPVD